MTGPAARVVAGLAPVALLVTLTGGGCTGHDSETATSAAVGNRASGAAPSLPDAQRLRIEPGGIRELCYTVKAGATMVYRFEATSVLDFNLHYDVGEQVYYPVPARSTHAEKGHFTVPEDRVYCLMWTNSGSVAAVLDAHAEGGEPYAPD